MLNLKKEATIVSFHFKTLLRRSWNKSSGIRLMRALRFSSLLIQAFGAVIISPKRTRIIASIYSWFRFVDNILDHDANPPDGYTLNRYVERVSRIIHSLECPSKLGPLLRKEDVLLIDALSLADQLEINIRQEIRNLWSCMLWDYQRRTPQTLQDKRALLENASKQDLTILSCCVKVFGGNSELIDNMPELRLGIFTRIGWLSDLHEDLAKGIINIPLEMVAVYSIDLDAVRAAKNMKALRAIPELSAWYQHELRQVKFLWHSLHRKFNLQHHGLASSGFVARTLHTFLVASLQSAIFKMSL